MQEAISSVQGVPFLYHLWDYLVGVLEGSLGNTRLYRTFLFGRDQCSVQEGVHMDRRHGEISSACLHQATIIIL